MKIRKEAITISAILVLFIVLSVIIFFFLRETSFEQVSDSSFKVTAPVGESTQQKQKNKNSILSTDVKQPEKQTPKNQENTVPEAKATNFSKNEEPELVQVKMTEHPEAHSAASNGKSINGFTYVQLKKGDNLWKIAERTGSHNPWRWTDIMDLNRDKIDYAYFNEDRNFWYVVVQKGITLKVSEKDIKVLSNKESWGKYSLQLAAFTLVNKELAENFVKQLLDDGYFAYVYKTDKNISSGRNIPQKYYRVRVGFFEDYGTAATIGETIKNRYQNIEFYDQDYFVVKPDKKEFNGDLFNYGIQMLNPYAVEFIQNEDRRTAVKLVKEISFDKYYMYMVKQDIGDEKYSVRAGFFPTLDAANRFIQNMNKTYNNRYSYARAIKLENIHEALAGQNVNFLYPQ